MPTYRDHGFVLRTRGLRDADRQYVVFTREHGKISVLAKGSRKGSSKLSPHLGSFGMVDIMVARGRSMDRLAGASMVESHRHVLSSLEHTALLQGFLAAVDALTKRELPDERVFELIREVQAALDAAAADAVEAAHTLAGQTVASTPQPGRGLLFDAACARLLDLLGFGVELSECVGCRSTLVPDGNAMNIIRGGVECARCRDAMAMTVSPETIKALRYLRTGPLETIARLRMDRRTRSDVAFVTDVLLTHHLESRFSALHYLRHVAG